MKKGVLFLVLILVAGGFAAAQQTSVVESAHYSVSSTMGSSDAQAIDTELEAYFTLFNSYFHFDPSLLQNKLNVRIYSTKSEYEAYLTKVVPGQTRTSFVFLQYSDPARSVLVGYHTQDGQAFQTNLIHHGFIQFLKSFIPHPPLWLEEGFAVYFESTGYNSSTGTATFKPNLGWLPTLKSGLQRYLANDTSQIITPASLMTIDASAANQKIDAFYAESWGLVSFLLNSSNKDFNRVIWDAINALSPSASLAENQSAIETKAFAWVSQSEIEKGFKDYIQGLRTFPELVQAGMKAYSSGKMKESQGDFKHAVSLDPTNYVPYYYLGLISYAGKDYYLAEQYFQTALQMGGGPGLVNYALGINAFADNRLSDAKEYLSKAVAVQSSYKDQAASLLARINKQSKQ